MKTKDGKSIFIDLDGEGWKFSSKNSIMNIDKGLYFGEKILLQIIKIYLFQE